jgi:hypothetical protein
MPSFPDLLARILSITAMPAVVGVLITAVMLVVIRDWRVDVIALAAQYFFVVLLMSRSIRLEMAAVKGLIGWLICLVFYVTEQQASALESSDEESISDRRWQWWVMSSHASFALLAAILVAVVAYIATWFMPLPESTIDITLACYLLAGLGMLLLGLGEGPLQVGLGLLMFLSGFDLFYVALVPSLVVAGLLGVINFVIALAMAYLRTAQFASNGEGETT